MRLFLNISITIQEVETTINPLMEPTPVEFTFETIGWTILLWIVILTTLIIVVRKIMTYRKSKYKRAALKVLGSLTTDTPEINQQIAMQLKLVAIQSYGRETVAHLSGKDWTAFLQSKGRHTEFKNLDTFLLECLYQNKLDDEKSKQFLTYSKKWIKTHA